MIASPSRALWQYFSAAGVLAALASCSGGSALPDPIEENDPGSISGELAVYIADLGDGTSETRYMLRDAAGEEQRLIFETEPEVEPGAKIHVWGTRAGDQINVSTYKRAFR